MQRKNKLIGFFTTAVLKSMLLCTVNTVVAKEYKVLEEQKIGSYAIGKSGLNRITMDPYKIMQVVGDMGDFKLQRDQDGKNIYIMPLKGVGSIIEVTLKNNIGDSVDLKLKVSNGPGKVIKINNQQIASRSDIESKIIKEMLSAMVSGKRGKYSGRKLRKDIFTKEAPHKSGLVMSQINIYEWEDLRGVVLELRSGLDHSISLNEIEFSKFFRSPIALIMSSTEIKPGEVVKAYVISKFNLTAMR